MGDTHTINALERHLQKRFASLPLVHPLAKKLAICGEIVSAHGFPHDRIYVEFALRFDSRFWQLEGPDWLLAQHRSIGEPFQHEHIINVRSSIALHFLSFTISPSQIDAASPGIFVTTNALGLSKPFVTRRICYVKIRLTEPDGIGSAKKGLSYRSSLYMSLAVLNPLYLVTLLHQDFVIEQTQQTAKMTQMLCR